MCPVNRTPRQQLGSISSPVACSFGRQRHCRQCIRASYFRTVCIPGCTGAAPNLSLSGVPETPSEGAFADELERRLVLETTESQRGVLWHYTDAHGLAGILQSRKIFATHFRHLNDPTELVHGEKIVAEVAGELSKDSAVEEVARSALQEFCEAYNNGQRFSEVADVYIASFCADDGDRLSQWRGYGARGSGYAIGFRALPVPKGEDSNADLVMALWEATYDLAKFRELTRTTMRSMAEAIVQFLLENLDTLTKTSDEQFRDAWARGRGQMLSHAATLAQRAKHPGFQEEQEWRVIVAPLRDERAVRYRATARGIVPYIELPLTDQPLLDLACVRVGPASDSESSVKALAAFLKSLGYAPELACRSEIPFRP
jgi:hypothetical protein